MQLSSTITLGLVWRLLNSFRCTTHWIRAGVTGPLLSKLSAASLAPVRQCWHKACRISPCACLCTSPACNPVYILISSNPIKCIVLIIRHMRGFFLGGTCLQRVPAFSAAACVMQLRHARGHTHSCFRGLPIRVWLRMCNVLHLSLGVCNLQGPLCSSRPYPGLGQKSRRIGVGGSCGAAFVGLAPHQSSSKPFLPRLPQPRSPRKPVVALQYP